jgi:hypothetical protein
MENNKPETFFERGEREANAAKKIYKRRPLLFWLLAIILGVGVIFYAGERFGLLPLMHLSGGHAKPQISKIKEIPWNSDNGERMIIFCVYCGLQEESSDRPYFQALSFRKDNHLPFGPRHIYYDLSDLLKDQTDQAPPDGKTALERFAISKERKEIDETANTERVGYFWDTLKSDASTITYAVQDKNGRTVASYDYSIK